MDLSPVRKGLDKVDTDLAPGHGWALLGADWDKTNGWKGTAEVGLKMTNWDLFGQAWYSGTAGGVGIGARW